MKMHLLSKNVLPGLTVESENAPTVKMHDPRVDSEVRTCTTHPQTHTGLSTSTSRHNLCPLSFTACKAASSCSNHMINPSHGVWLQLAYVITQDYYRIAENIGGCKNWRKDDCSPNFGTPK